MRNKAKAPAAIEAAAIVAEAEAPAIETTEAPAMPEAEAVSTEAPATTEAEAPEAPATEAPEAEAAPAIDYAALRREAVKAFRAFNASAISIPVKPILVFKAYRPAIGVLKAGMRPSPRQAAALCVAVLASGQRFSTEAEAPAITFSRRFTLTDAAYAVENGASADCVSSGLATYDADAEAFTVTSAQAKAIRGLLGKLAAPAFA